MSDLSSLIARLEAAEGPSDELDAHIRCVLLADKEAYVEQSKFNGAWCVYSGEYRGSPRLVEPQRYGVPHPLWVAEYTRSIDAAVSLAERVMPGRSVMMGWRQSSETKPWARVGLWPDPDATAATPALALVLATLRALQQKGGAQ